MAATIEIKRRRSRAKRRPSVERVDRTGLPIDQIIRVSRVGSRDISSEKYLTEKQQQETIAHILAAKQLTPGKLFVSRDESGADWVDDRDNLAEAMERVRSGESAGIAVAYFSRFARTASEAIGAIKELNELGAVFISAREALDSTTEMGRFALGMMALFSELEWNRLAAGWRSTVESVINQGRYIAGAVPTGYLKGDDGRLVKDPVAGPIIRELFLHRVEDGWSWTKLADWLTEQGVRPNTAKMTERTRPDRPARAERYGAGGWKRWSTGSIKGLIENPAYAGVARQLREDGEFVNHEAHEAIVEDWLWTAAQSARTSDVNGGRTGEMSDQAMLRSLCFCETCGHSLLVTGRSDKKAGKRLPIYYCRGRYSTGDCAARANIDSKKIDSYVEGLFLDHVADRVGVRRAAKQQKERLAQLQGLHDKLEADYQYWLQTPGLKDDVGEADYRVELRRRREAKEKAADDLFAERKRQQVTSDVASGRILEYWNDLTIVERREILTDLIDRVVVKPAHGRKGRGAPPVEERVVVHWVAAFE